MVRQVRLLFYPNSGLRAAGCVYPQAESCTNISCDLDDSPQAACLQALGSVRKRTAYNVQTPRLVGISSVALGTRVACRSRQTSCEPCAAPAKAGTKTCACGGLLLSASPEQRGAPTFSARSPPCRENRPVASELAPRKLGRGRSGQAAGRPDRDGREFQDYAAPCPSPP